VSRDAAAALADVRTTRVKAHLTLTSNISKSRSDLAFACANSTTGPSCVQQRGIGAFVLLDGELAAVCFVSHALVGSLDGQTLSVHSQSARFVGARPDTS
jgi:hypothetical protein